MKQSLSGSRDYLLFLPWLLFLLTTLLDYISQHPCSQVDPCDCDWSMGQMVMPTISTWPSSGAALLHTLSCLQLDATQRPQRTGMPTSSVLLRMVQDWYVLGAEGGESPNVYHLCLWVLGLNSFLKPQWRRGAGRKIC
jgi:hypothetical protein